MVAKRLHNLSCLLPPSLLLDARGSDTKWEMEIGGMRIEKREAPWILQSGNAPKRSGGQVPRARRSRPQGPAREPHRSELLSRKKNAHYTYESAPHSLFIGVRCVLTVKKWVNSRDERFDAGKNNPDAHVHHVLMITDTSHLTNWATRPGHPELRPITQGCANAPLRTLNVGSFGFLARSTLAAPESSGAVTTACN